MQVLETVLSHLNYTFYKQTLNLTANIECNSTVIKLPKTEKAILFVNLYSHSMVAVTLEESRVATRSV